MLNSASKTTKFFYRDVDSTYPFWRLKTPEEHEAETNNKSKEARKYIFNCLDDIGQVNVPTDIEGGQLLAEKTDRREFIDLLKRMLTIDQERRITPGEALNHPFTTLAHLVDYAHCNNVKASVQMMEVCRRDSSFHAVQPTTATLVTNFVPNTTENMTFTINNQLSSQVQRISNLVRERAPATTYDNLYQIYGPRNVARQYTNTRTAEAAFQHQLVSSILCPTAYQTMSSPTTKHVVVGSAGMQPSLQVPPQQLLSVPVSMVEPASGQRMLLTNAVQSSVAWPQGGRQVAIVPSWTQQAGPHSLIVDSAPFLNVEEIYPKHHLNIQKYETKKLDSPVHHLVVPRHDKKETNQLSPVKKRVKENTPPHHHLHHHQQQVQLQQQSQHPPRYNNPQNHRSSYQSSHHHLSPHQNSQPQQYQNSSSFYAAQNQLGGHYVNDSGLQTNNQYQPTMVLNPSNVMSKHQPPPQQQQTITIHDTPSPSAVITISDSEDEEQSQQQQQKHNNNQQRSRNNNNNNNNNNTGNYQQPSTSSTNSNSNQNQNGSNKNNGNPQSVISVNNNSQRHRKNVISCVTVGDSDNEDAKTPKQNTGKFTFIG
jgi:homeodomain interacting protein kinase